MKTVLLDADVTLHTATHGATSFPRFGDEITQHVDLSQAFELVDHEIAELKKNFETDTVICCFSYSGPPWRRDVYPEYKIKRKGEKPKGYGEVRAYMMNMYESYDWPPLEGDDVLGILATSQAKSFVQHHKFGTDLFEHGSGAIRIGPPEDRLIVSIDKDMRTLPEVHIAKSFGSDEIEYIPKDEANYNFYLQALMGDSTDGYSGCPGIGPRTGAKLLDGLCGEDDMWHTVLQAYDKAGLRPSDALANARCARILRVDEYDFAKQYPVLWEPPF